MSRSLSYTTLAAAQTAQGQMNARVQAFCAADGYAVDGSGNVSPHRVSDGSTDAAGQKTQTWFPIAGAGPYTMPHPEYHTLRRDLPASIGRNFVSYVMQDLGSPTITGTAFTFDPTAPTAGGWSKVSGQHISTLGGANGTLFDPCVINDAGTYKMWVSNRFGNQIAYAESTDGGLTWTTPILITLAPASGWAIARASVLKMGAGDYRMWYTEQQGSSNGNMRICYATSADGKVWTPYSGNPIMTAQAGWESQVDPAISGPLVVWDAPNTKFRMWYAGGEFFEPIAIGYAESPDGITWTRNGGNPIFGADTTRDWEKAQVAPGCVFFENGYWTLFYIGYADSSAATICAARSADGITNWERHALNPLIRKSQNPADQDGDACYRAAVILDGGVRKMWYNGRNNALSPTECIMMATLQGSNLWF